MSAVERDGVRVQMTVVVELTGEQVRDYAAAYGLPSAGGSLTARELVGHIRSDVLTGVQDSAAFGENAYGTRGATVTMKGN